MAGVMGCRDAVEHLWTYLDGELDDADHLALEQHLRFCLRCCGEVAFARELQGLLADRSRPGLPTGVQERLEGFIDRLEPGDPPPPIATTGGDHG